VDLALVIGYENLLYYSTLFYRIPVTTEKFSQLRKTDFSCFEKDIP